MAAQDIAQFMADQFNDRDYVYQSQIVNAIIEKFGDEYIYRNKNGNRAISPEVLKLFRQLTRDVVWERGSQRWRKMRPDNRPGRRGIYSPR